MLGSDPTRSVDGSSNDDDAEPTFGTRLRGALALSGAHSGRSSDRAWPRGRDADDRSLDAGRGPTRSSLDAKAAPRVTRFFVAGIESDRARDQEVYSELRARSLLDAGCPARPRRIFKLSCRFDGHDREIEVGKPLSRRGSVVLAILDHGRFEAFRVHTDGPGEDAVTRVNHPVYSVTEFT
jgi:hypothetical protein